MKLFLLSVHPIITLVAALALSAATIVENDIRLKAYVDQNYRSNGPKAKIDDTVHVIIFRVYTSLDMAHLKKAYKFSLRSLGYAKCHHSYVRCLLSEQDVKIASRGITTFLEHRRGIRHHRLDCLIRLRRGLALRRRDGTFMSESESDACALRCWQV